MPEIRARGLGFHYQRLGQGSKRVLFVHGFVWDNLSSWYFSVATSVAAKAEVMLYDLRGHGLTEQPANGYSLDDMVLDLGALLDETGFGSRPIHLVGNSFGGLVATAFAASFPERVASLVLVDALVGDETWAADVRKTLLTEGEARERRITKDFRAWTGRYGDPKNTRLAKAAERLVRDTSLLDDLAASREITQEDLDRISCPVLALYGEKSHVHTKGKLLAESLNRCDLEIVPGGSHVILLEAPEFVRERLMAWLEQQRA